MWLYKQLPFKESLLLQNPHFIFCFIVESFVKAHSQTKIGHWELVVKVAESEVAAFIFRLLKLD